ncbi:unnamed protein product, partial [Iphiclides podalirius]
MALSHASLGGDPITCDFVIRVKNEQPHSFGCLLCIQSQEGSCADKINKATRFKLSEISLQKHATCASLWDLIMRTPLCLRLTKMTGRTFSGRKARRTALPPKGRKE